MKKFFLYGVLMLALLASTTLAGKDKRNFVTIFQLTEYNAKVTDGVEYLFNKVLEPQDHLILFSPVKPYDFPPQIRQKYPLKN